jgi:hypothetical protein
MANTTGQDWIAMKLNRHDPTTDLRRFPPPHGESMTNSPAPTSAVEIPTPDGTPLAACDIQRGVLRLLAAHAFAAMPEVALPDGRRADVVGVSEKGLIWIVEIKSSVADLRADHKWPDYRAHCDRLLFAVASSFPRHLLPIDAGLILADRYGGHLVELGVEHPLVPARRKALTLRFARAAALRLARINDPGLDQT